MIPFNLIPLAFTMGIKIKNRIIIKKLLKGH